METENEIRAHERKLYRHVEWKDGELGYLHCLIAQRGDDNVGRDPKTVAAYLRVQASSAFDAGLFTLAACIGDAATAVNCDARNNHAPNWTRAAQSLKKANETA